jgi:hypothetical protein
MDQYRNSDNFRGFFFNKVIISQKFYIFKEIFLQLRTYFSRIWAKLGAFSFEKDVFFKKYYIDRRFFIKKVLIFQEYRHF